MIDYTNAAKVIAPPRKPTSVPFIELLRWPLFWLVVVVILIAQVLLIISAVRMRPTTGQATSPLASATHVELGWTLATAAALSTLLIFIYRALSGV